MLFLLFITGGISLSSTAAAAAAAAAASAAAAAASRLLELLIPVFSHQLVPHRRPLRQLKFLR